MRAQILLVWLVTAAALGCADSDRDNRSASNEPLRTQAPAPLADFRNQPPADHSRNNELPEEAPVPLASPTITGSPEMRTTDVEPLRRLPAIDDNAMMPMPLLSRQLAPEEAPDRTALAPPSFRSLATPPAREPPPEPFTTIRVFYGTNRGETGSRDPKEMYGSRPSDTSYGFCDVSIPKRHKVGKLESPSIWRFEFREDPEKHIVLLRVLKANRGQFLSTLRQKVWGSMEVVDTPQGPALTGGEVFIFVHGYNNSFEDAARRTAQIAYDLKFAGAPVMYSWPSQAKSSLDAYRHDGQMAGWSEEHLINFVASVARDSGARRVHLIAHSMGNRILAGALRRLVDHSMAGHIPRFNEVILSAPDVDAEYFKTAIAPRITHSADRITIYSSSRDYALKISSFFNPHARKRLGEAGDKLTVFPEYANIDVVDATEVETDLFSLNHSYHADSPTILSDMSLLLQGYSTEQRGLVSALNQLAWQIRNVGRQITEGVTPARQ